MSDGSEDFYRSILDSMTQQVADIDDQGFIQWVLGSFFARK